MRTLFITAVSAALFSVLVKVSIAPTRTVAGVVATKSQSQNVLSIGGLHVAVPPSVKNVPVGLVPQP